MAEFLTEQDIHQFRLHFDQLDTDRDGLLSIEELSAFFTHEMGSHLLEEELHDMIIEFDENKNGQIEFEEFLAMQVKKNLMIGQEEEIWKIFQAFDSDKNGYISAPELRNVMATLGENLSEEEIAAMIREADIDGDGHINYEEFVRVMMFS